MTEKNRIKGKKNRGAGLRFERKVRKDLEKKGFVVDKWSNNIEFGNFCPKCFKKIEQGTLHNRFVCHNHKNNLNEDDSIYFNQSGIKKAMLIPAKRKFNPFKKVLGIGTGMPDFIIFRRLTGKEILEDLKNDFQKRNETTQ